MVVMKNSLKAMDSGFAFFPGEFLTDNHRETQGLYIWRPASKGTYKGPNVWRNTLRSWTDSLAITEVSSYKFPGKPSESGIGEGNWWTFEEFMATRDTNVSQTTLSAVTLGLFSKELQRFSVKTWMNVFTKIFTLRKSATKADEM